MVSTANPLPFEPTTEESQNNKTKKHIKLNAINYQRNVESDYTEKIAELDKSFSYSDNQHTFWGAPELSTLYGTPLYEEASQAQKLALNHLYWARQYNQTAATEANAVLYNQITAGVFATLSGYDVLCQELDLETDQERYHIHAFHSIGYKTKRALLGKSAFGASMRNRSASSPQRVRAKIGKAIDRPTSSIRKQLTSSNVREKVYRLIAHQIMLKDKAPYYSKYLQELDKKGEPIPVQTTGLVGQWGARPFLQFFTLNCGSSPFLACLFYVTRYMANMLLKNYEYRYCQYYRELQKQDVFIPAPTAISNYHLQDEAFHTTTSQLIARDLYKDFYKPTAYEKALANTIVYRVQRVGHSGLSGGLPAVFRNDADFIESFYQLLQSPLFEMNSSDALHWLKKCLCKEHEGFHINLKYHHRLLADLRRFFDGIDYLWPVNREMRLMQAGGSIEKALKNNRQAFKQLTRTIAASA
ncbi:MAG: hypothetical protein AB4040_17265 [Synechococcus sp.]